MTARRRTLLLLLTALVGLHVQAHGQRPYQYFRVGSPDDVSPKTQAGFALVGGGKDLDEAFQWMCARSGGGDILILRSHGTDAYNPYIQGLCHVNSVATLVIPSREAAASADVAQVIAKAEAIFIAGGDQAEYINFWKGTPVQEGINQAIRRGVPVGGTSAGLAVQGEYVYSAQNDLPNDPNLSSSAALQDPFDRQIVVVRGFLDNPLLANVMTDSHFVTRDRMGRLLAMMARILDTGTTESIGGIGIDERTAVLIEADGRVKIAGFGAAYFLRSSGKARVMKAGSPLSFGPVSAVKLGSGGSFDLRSWSGSAGPWTYSVDAGVVSSSRSGSSLY